MWQKVYLEMYATIVTHPMHAWLLCWPFLEHSHLRLLLVLQARSIEEDTGTKPVSCRVGPDAHRGPTVNTSQDTRTVVVVVAAASPWSDVLTNNTLSATVNTRAE